MQRQKVSPFVVLKTFDSIWLKRLALLQTLKVYFTAIIEISMFTPFGRPAT